MRKQPESHTAYVLWLVRKDIVHSWSDLCAHYKIDPSERFTQHNMLFSSLESLAKAGLIEITPEPQVKDWLPYKPDTRFSVTPLLPRIQEALSLSLTELAKSDINQRLLVTPVLGRTFSSRYESDILVLMPFSNEMRPIYDDHLQIVAQELGKKIARADDFFTAEYIIDEIWTAMINATMIIADCTGRNPNVFYEIGLAHAIGKPTILITQNDDDIPFDLRHRRYIRYEYTPRGMRMFEEQLRKTIQTIIDEYSNEQ